MESAKGMARGTTATWEAAKMSTLEMFAKGVAQGAATWDAAKMSTLEMSAKGMAKQRNSYITNTIT